jgi:hypothetical protein
LALLAPRPQDQSNCPDVLELSDGNFAVIGTEATERLEAKLPSQDDDAFVGGRRGRSTKRYYTALSATRRLRQQTTMPLASAGARAVGLAYIAYKGAVTIVRTYERTVVPGLLQTEEYGRTLLQSLQQSQVDERLLL